MSAWTPRPPAGDEPACWSWPVPAVRDHEALLLRVAAAHPGYLDYETLRLVFYEPEWVRWREFHTGVPLEVDPQAPTRCAMCGRTPPVRLVEDHCHATGQIRGLLCRRCNAVEGRRGNGRWAERYRRVHPAAILDTHEMYSGFTWLDGWDLRLPGGTGMRPATPWPPLSV